MTNTANPTFYNQINQLQRPFPSFQSLSLPPFPSLSLSLHSILFPSPCLLCVLTIQTQSPKRDCNKPRSFQQKNPFIQMNYDHSTLTSTLFLPLFLICLVWILVAFNQRSIPPRFKPQPLIALCHL